MAQKIFKERVWVGFAVTWASFTVSILSVPTLPSLPHPPLNLTFQGLECRLFSNCLALSFPSYTPVLTFRGPVYALKNIHELVTCVFIWSKEVERER